MGMKLMTTAFPVPLGSEKLPFLLLKLTSLTCKLICLRERYSKKGLIGNTKEAGQNLGRNLSLMLRVCLLKSELTMETINMPSGQYGLRTNFFDFLGAVNDVQKLQADSLIHYVPAITV